MSAQSLLQKHYFSVIAPVLSIWTAWWYLFALFSISLIKRGVCLFEYLRTIIDTERWDTERDVTLLTIQEGNGFRHQRGLCAGLWGVECVEGEGKTTCRDDQVPGAWSLPTQCWECTPWFCSFLSLLSLKYSVSLEGRYWVPSASSQSIEIP